MMPMAGCITSTVGRWSTGALIESAGQRELSDRVRLAAIDELLVRQLDPNQHARLGQVFGEVVGSSLHSPVIRRRVTVIIADRYREEAAVWLGGALVNCGEEESRGQIVDILVELKDRKAIPYLVISFADKAGSSDKYKSGLEEIAGESWEKVLLGQLANGGSLRVRIAAIGCLLKENGTESVVQAILEQPADDGFMEQLGFWAKRFGYVPSNIMRFFQCSQQQQRLSPEEFDKLQGLVSLLRGRDGYRYDVRDSYLLLRTAGDIMEVPRSGLIREIGSRLTVMGHSKRRRSYPGAADDYKETFLDQSELLSYADLLRIRLLLADLALAATVEKLSVFLQEDISDTKTELGGLCFIEDGGISWKKYPPGKRLGDNQYIESDELIAEAAVCMARWHLHTDMWRGEELAGPGIDDLRHASWCNSPEVVITCVSDKKFNVDYYTAEGVVIDLGNYTHRV